MSRKNKFTEEKSGDVDMTPMLDIVFILLIFFIVTTSFVREEGLMVNRPKLNKASNDSAPAMAIRITDSGIVSFNGKIVDIERLPARIENFLAKNDSTSASLYQVTLLATKRLSKLLTRSSYLMALPFL